MHACVHAHTHAHHAEGVQVGILTVNLKLATPPSCEAKVAW